MNGQPDLFPEFTDDALQEIVDRWTRYEHMAKHGIKHRPEPEFLATFIRLQRRTLSWKKETLASFADVSLSIVERVERGQRVSTGCLDKLAVALGYQRGDFTEPRVPLVGGEAAAFISKCMEPLEGRKFIDVEPIHKHRQIAGFGNCHINLIDASRLSVDVDAQIAVLREWLDFVSYVLDDKFATRNEREKRKISRRRLYGEILNHVREIECKTNSITLGGTYEAKTDNRFLPEALVAVIGFFPRDTDPAAIKRRQLLVPERISVRGAMVG